MEGTSPISTARRADLDWLRFIAILILLFFHTGMWFNTWGWHVKNSETSESFNAWMVWLHFWRMPLLLFISGAGTYMALGKRSPGQFAKERFRRLFIPLLFGMFVVVPPQIYYEHIKDYPDYWSFYKTVFEFVPYPRGSFSWHHLWFVLYLLLYSLILIPFLVYIRSPRSLAFRETLSRWLSNPFGMLLIPAFIIFLTQLALRPYFPEETHDLKDLAYFVFYMMFFFFGILCYSDQRIWTSIETNRKKFVAAALFMLIPFYSAYMGFYEIIKFPWKYDTTDTIFEITGIFLSWFTIVALIGVGQHHLNKPHPWLSYVNEGLYPFYILHQTVIIAIGYYICQLDWSMLAKFFTIAFLTLISCIGLFLVIRLFNVTRLLFGLKRKKVSSYEF